MDDQTERETSSHDPEAPPADLDEGPHVGFVTAEEFEQRVVETRTHGRRHGTPQHVNLDQEEYTPDEIALLIGTSLEVVIRAIRYGDLKASRVGHDVIAVKHEDVTDWLRRRGGV